MSDIYLKKFIAELKILSVCCLFAFPVWFIYLQNFSYSHQNELTSIGVIQYDQIGYIAHAREYIDHDSFNFFESNPFSHSYDSPKLYFPVFLFLLSLLFKFGLSIAEGWLLAVFLSTLFFIRASLLIMTIYLPLNGIRKWLAFAFFFWGGGLLSLGGYTLSVLKSDVLKMDIFRLDPCDGWWFMNLGRNSVYPTEAFYHGMFFLGFAFILWKKPLSFLLTSTLIIFMHPFTAVQYLLILGIWCYVERVIVKSTLFSTRLSFAVLLLLISLAFYYGVYLPSFEEHRAVTKIFTAYVWGALLYLENMLPAYCLVALMVCFTFKNTHAFRHYFSDSKFRLALIWFIVSLLLSNNEAFLRHPIQPAHFTRGYIYTALFLLGSGFLVQLLNRIHLKKLRGNIAIVMLLILFCSDNISWFCFHIFYPGHIAHAELCLPKDDVTLLDKINTLDKKPYLLVSLDSNICYHAMVHTPYRSWRSKASTPNSEEKLTKMNHFFENGTIPEEWVGQTILFILRNEDELTRPLLNHLNYEKIFNNTTYSILINKF